MDPEQNRNRRLCNAEAVTAGRPIPERGTDGRKAAKEERPRLLIKEDSHECGYCGFVQRLEFDPLTVPTPDATIRICEGETLVYLSL